MDSAAAAIFDRIDSGDPADGRTAHWTRARALPRLTVVEPDEHVAEPIDAEPTTGLEVASRLHERDLEERRRQLRILADLEETRRAAETARRTLAPATVEAYRLAWAHWQAFCSLRGLTTLPAEPEAVAVHLQHRADAGASLSTIQIGLAGIVAHHKQAGHTSPRESRIVKNVLAGLRRVLGVTPKHRKAPLLTSETARWARSLPHARGLTGVRDVALVLLGNASGLRRSELVALRREHVTIESRGAVILIERSKTDQCAKGQTVHVYRARDLAVCPVAAVERWIAAAGIEPGTPLFRRTDRGGRVLAAGLAPAAVARRCKLVARALDLDPKTIGAHSLRRGMATSAARAGKGDRAIQEQGRWQSPAMLAVYIAPERGWSNDASAGLFDSTAP